MTEVAATRPASASSVEICPESECDALEAFLVERIYAFNTQATGLGDGMLLGARIRDTEGALIGALNGHTWGGCCVIAHLWVHEAHRARGLGTDLLMAAEAEAVRRGCVQAVLSTHDFQAPGFYERHGYRARATIRGWPRGYAGVLYVKALTRAG